MAKSTTLKKPAAATAAPKLNKAKAAAKPAKALKGKAKSTEPKLNVKPGGEVTFKGYAETPENPIFETGDRLTVVEVTKNADGQQVFAVVRSEDYEAYQTDPESVNGDEVFSTEIEKAEKVAVDPYALALREDTTLDEYIGEHEGDPLLAATAAIEDAAMATFMLGGCLAQLYSGQKFREYGDYADDEVEGVAKAGTGWDRFCQENFDQGGRKAHALVQIYRNYNGLSDVLDLGEIARDKKIGWVKLSAAANVINTSNATALIERMRSENVTDFRESIKTDYADAGVGGETRSGTAKVRRTTFKAVFFEDAAIAVEEVITAAKKQVGTDDLGTVLELIIMQWASENLSDTANKKVRSARKTKLNELKKSGVDTTERLQAMTDLEAQIEAARGEEGEASEENEL